MKKKGFNWSDARVAKLKKMIGEGFSQVEMANKFDASIDTIRYALEKHDLQWQFDNAVDERTARRAKLKAKAAKAAKTLG